MTDAQNLQNIRDKELAKHLEDNTTLEDLSVLELAEVYNEDKLSVTTDIKTSYGKLKFMQDVFGEKFVNQLLKDSMDMYEEEIRELVEAELS